MRSASATFRRTMSQRRNFVNYADMTLADGTVLHLQPEDFRLGGNTIHDDIVDGDAFCIGTALGKTVTIALDNTDELFSLYNFYGATFFLYVALPLDTEPQTVEKIRIGYFTVITPATTGTVITMEAVDNMYKFDRPYSESSLAYPATLKSIIADACTHCGVTDGTGEFDRWNMTVIERPSSDVTYRQVVSYVAQIACVNAKISEIGSLIFTWYTDTIPEEYADGGNFRRIYKPDGSYKTGVDLDGGSFNPWNLGDEFDGGLFTDPVACHDLGFAKSVQVGTDDITITGVKIKNGDNEYMPATCTEDYCLVIEDNPLTIGSEITIGNAVWAKVMYMTFRPFSLSYLQDPTIESGDWVIVSDAKLNTYFTFCTSVEFTTGGYTNISCKAQSPAQQFSTYTSQSAKAIVQNARQADERISSYDTAVQRMNALASNAMGMFTLEVGDPIDGSSIYYISNKPIVDNQGIANFTQNSTVWKMTGDGFFACTNAAILDSDCDWTQGWDVEGNVVVNTLSTIGLNADWINTGTLTVDESMQINSVYTYQKSGTTYQSSWQLRNGGIHYIPPTGLDPQCEAFISMSSNYFKLTPTFPDYAEIELFANGAITLNSLSGYDDDDTGATITLNGGKYGYDYVRIDSDGDINIEADDTIEIIADTIKVGRYGYSSNATYSGTIVNDWTYDTVSNVCTDLQIDSDGTVSSYNIVTLSIPVLYTKDVLHGFVMA